MMTPSDITLYYDERRIRQLITDTCEPYTGDLTANPILATALPPDQTIAALTYWNLLARRGMTDNWVAPNIGVS